MPVHELTSARRHLEASVESLEKLARDLDDLLNYTVDLSSAEAQGLSLLHDRITKALIILREVI